MTISNDAMNVPTERSLLPLATAKVAVLMTVMVAPFWPTWQGLSAEWWRWDEALGHGSLIALATVYFLFTTAMTTNSSTQGSTARVFGGIVITLIFALFASLSQRVALDAVTQLALVGLLFGLVLVFFPTVSLLRAIQVSGLLIFSVQAWGSLNGILLWAASNVVGSAVGWLSIPTLIDGSSITLPHGIMLIADGCSGLRYFIIALALAWMLGLVNGYGPVGMLATLAIAVVMALIMNWIRIFLLILVGYYSEMQHSLVQDHELFGWVLFAVFVLPAMYFSPMSRRREQS